ncbi:hypothetical protein B0H14DRAFT_2655407 [Mycena olivaceomarginata]|nr:hypothetical protein B0H14DRAFT_2655407 [Mycena olivaceomarginata]
MSNNHWDVTPSDTNAIEGSHAEDNRIDKGNDTLLEVILKKLKADRETADVFEKLIKSGIWANGNNSQRARFTSQATRAAKACEKCRTDGTERRRLESRLQASELEFLNIRAQLNSQASTIHSALNQPEAGPSRGVSQQDTTFKELAQSPQR